MKLARREEGSALIELAIFMPVLTLLFVGVIDYGLETQQAMQIAQAASAGAAYGTIPGNSKDIAGMQSAATSSAAGMHGFTATASTIYTCNPGGSIVTSGTTCSGYGTPITYVQVRASAVVPTMLAFPGMPASLNLSQTTTFRVPWTP